MRRRPPLSLRPAWLLSHLRWLRRNHARLGCRLILRRRPALATLLRWLWSQRLLLLRVPHRWRPLCFSLAALFALRLPLRWRSRTALLL